MTYSFMLAKEYNVGMKLPKELGQSKVPIGWLLSEKYDGYRARFDSDKKCFVSRAQKGFNAPEWFKQAMIPVHHLDDAVEKREFDVSHGDQRIIAQRSVVEQPF